MSDEAIAQAEKLIPCEVRMISGCQDEQTSADVSNVASFQLPDPKGKAGGALTSAMLNVLYKDHTNTTADMTFKQTLLGIRAMLKQGSYDQIPQLSSSRPMDIDSNFDLAPEKCKGTRRAVMIGINYVGQQGELSGCHNDVGNMLEYIKKVHGFEDQNITILMDDGQHTEPTSANIIAAYKKIVSESVSGDVVFCHYSGHGGKMRDDDGDEKDGYDETLVPVDYNSAGQIRDDDIFSTLIGPMAKGVVMTCVMDCCHSGSVLDLPFVFKADGEQETMQMPPDFDFAALQGLFKQFMALQSGSGSNDPVAMILSQCCTLM